MTTKIGSPLTERQKDILVFIKSHYLANGVPPTIRDVLSKFDMQGPNAVNGHMISMAKKGFILLGKPKSTHRFKPVVPEGHCLCCGQPLSEAALAAIASVSPPPGPEPVVRRKSGEGR